MTFDSFITTFTIFYIVHRDYARRFISRRYILRREKKIFVSRKKEREYHLSARLNSIFYVIFNTPYYGTYTYIYIIKKNIYIYRLYII